MAKAPVPLTSFSEGAHRMACARCPFYRPKTDSVEQLVEGKATWMDRSSRWRPSIVLGENAEEVHCAHPWKNTYDM